MKAKLFVATSITIVVTALGAMLCIPLSGCSRCSTDRGSAVVEKTDEGSSAKKRPEKASSGQEDEHVSADADTAQEAAADVTDIQPSNESKTATTAQGNSSKTSSSKTSGPENTTSKPVQSKQKWIPEQGHWETDYDQVWVPNIVYTRHERYWVNRGGTNIGPFDSKAAAWAWCDNDVENGGIGGSVIDDSYTTTEDQGHYEQQATGQHWVVDTPGHWE